MDTHERHLHQILTEIGEERELTQRSLSKNLGIALGLTNLLIRRVVRRGWVRVIRIRKNRVRYFLTPAGIAEKGRMSHAFLEYTIRFYADARRRVRESLSAVSERCAALGSEPGAKRIVFFGNGEVAEVAYVCLQETDLHLVGIVGESGDTFFGMRVTSESALQLNTLDGAPFDCLVVTTFGTPASMRIKLESLGVPSDRVHWL